MDYKKYLAAIVALIILVALFFGTKAIRDRSTNRQTNNANNAVTQNENNSTDQTTKTFTSTQQGYSFDYPTALDNYNTGDLGNSSSPNANYGLPREIDNSGFMIEKTLAKILPVQYCGLSGMCKNTTTNFAIYVGGETFKQSELLQSNIGKSLTKTSIGGRSVYKYEIGAEGEGIIYYFVIGPNDKMVSFSLTYMNQNVLSKYQKVADFTPYSEQIQTVENIISSLKFQ